METITTTRFIDCGNCGKSVDKCYTDSHFTDKKVCYDCVLGANNNRFPMGKGAYLPCQLCVEPNIHWYHRSTCATRQNDCGGHSGSA